MKREEVLESLRKQLLFARNSILITEDNLVPIDEDKHLITLLTVSEELKKLGYRLSDYCLTHMSDLDLEAFHKECLPILYEVCHKKFEPLYPGFPDQVIDTKFEKLWKDQHQLYRTLDYNNFAEHHPWYSEEEVTGPKKLKVLEEMTISKLFDLFTNLLKSPCIAEDGDIKLLPLIFYAFPEFELPANIPNKTIYALTLCYRGCLKAKDVNDVLRVMAIRTNKRVEGKVLFPLFRSDSDTKKVIRNPRRIERLDAVIQLQEIIERKGLENCVLDAKKYYNLWVIFGRIYHFGDYRSKFPKVAEFIHTLFTPKELKKLSSWNSKLHQLYHTLNKDTFPRLVDFIAKRPGEYMRRLDSLIRKAASFGIDPEECVINRLIDLDINSKLLLEVLNYYDKRMAGAPRLVYNEAGELMKSLPILSQLPEDLGLYINYLLCMKIYDNIKKFNKDGDIYKNEKIFFSPELKKVPVPYNMRGAGCLSPRGTRIPLPENINALRLFVKWIDETGKEDLDLHGTFIDSDGKVMNIGWNSSYVEDFGVFSGDVRKRKGSCAEYINVNMISAKQRFDYLVATVHNFERRPLNSLDAWIGYEILPDYRKKVSEKYYPGDVDFDERLEANYTSMAAFMLDFKKMEIVILNTDLTAIPSSAADKSRDIIKFFNSDPTFTVYNIAHAWYTARGAEVVETPEEATKVISIDDLKDYTTVQGMLSL